MKLRFYSKAFMVFSTITFFCACSTAGSNLSTGKLTENSASKVTEAKTTRTLADSLSQTKTSVKSDDGKIICKRTTVIGSNFKRKVCATANEWEARAVQDKKTTGDIQRGGTAPGTSN